MVDPARVRLRENPSFTGRIASLPAAAPSVAASGGFVVQLK